MSRWTESERYVARELGRVFLSEGRSALARQIFAGLISLDQNDSYAHAGLGIACTQLGELKAADRALSEAIRLAPEDWTAALHLAELRLRDGATTASRDAVQLAERATRSNHCPSEVRRRAEYLVGLHGRE